jgi:rfaE bifunctional protein kinase chain/domain/rfaE bifunctional protein nucleotidyltransferase chain/domain
MKNKISSIEKLEQLVKKAKSKNKKIVLCHGVFDLLHIGHIKHFQEAKSYGDVLIVTITPSEFVNKGPLRPAFNDKLRLEALASLEIIDYVGVNYAPTATKIISKIKPNIYCKGPDYKNNTKDITGEIKNEIRAVKKIGGKIIYTKAVAFSSSNLINKYLNLNNNNQKCLINKVKKKYNYLKIKNLIESLKKLKILVVGEVIIDEYVFCEALGKSGKEPMLVLRDLRREEYLGGSAAISRHISDFCKKVSLYGMIGDEDNYENKIKKDLPKNISFNYLKKRNSPTIVKKRFLDNIGNKKVLGVYKINDEILAQSDEKKFNKYLQSNLNKFDLVIVSDYGHGFISNRNAKLICQKSRSVALNAQVNAANIGYHSMRKYNNIDCVIINETEIRHELRDKNEKIEDLMKKLSKERKIKNLIVTRGKKGSVIYNKIENKFNYSEALANNDVDKIGAGDAMLALSAMCIKLNLDRNLSLLLGSLAAAQSVETIGNKHKVSKIKILKSLENIIK